MTVQEIPRPSELTIIGPPASNFRVLMLYPNIQSETMVPPSLALFSAILKREGFKVRCSIPRIITWKRGL